MASLKLVSLNVRGLGDFKKRKMIFLWAKRQKADILLLQETHSTNNLEQQWKNEWGGEIIFSHGTNRARGVAILIRQGLEVEQMNMFIDCYGRFIFMQAEINGIKVQIVNTYAPTAERDITNFLRSLRNKLLDFISND